MAPAVMLDQLRRLLELFASASPDRTTLDALLAIVVDRGRWATAKGVFNEVRRKALELRVAPALGAQYRFEEACAKTLYNLTMGSAPFDPESPYWIVPRALEVARHGIGSQCEVLKIVGEARA